MRDFRNCPPRSLEQQICDLQLQLDLLKKQLLPPWENAGEWQKEVNYNQANIFVSYNGGSYVRREQGDCINLAPDLNPTYWQLVAKKGDPGSGLPGAPGRGITRLENTGTSQGQGFTITHIQANMTDGTSESFDVQAENGTPAQYINITSVPSTATSGTLTEEELILLSQNPQNNYIMFYGEKFIPMDIQDSQGYRVYTHHGETKGTKKETSKFIYIILSTRAWTMNINTTKEYFRHFIKMSKGTYEIYFELINTRSIPYNLLSSDIVTDIPYEMSATGSFTQTEPILSIGKYNNTNQLIVSGIQALSDGGEPTLSFTIVQISIPATDWTINDTVTPL